MGKRKSNGEGSFTKLPSGKVRGRFVDDIDGIAVRSSFTAKSESACRKLHSEWLQSESKMSIERVQTVGDWADHWLEVYKHPEPGKPASGYKDYKMYVERHIKPAIGKMTLSSVRPAHIKKLFKDARTKPNASYPDGRPLSRSASEKLLWALQGIFDTAVDNRLCPSSPVKGVELPPKSKKAPSVFRREHMREIVDFINIHEYGPHVALFFYSGLRPGEGFGLMWSDIDQANHTFLVQRSLTLVEEGGRFVYRVTPGTKTDEFRTVTYNQALDPLLDRLPKTGMYVLSRTEEIRDDLGDTSFVSTHHTHSTYNEIYYRFFDDLNDKIIRGSVGTEPHLIPRLTPHKMRHTFATYLRKSGADLDEIRELLGHKSITTTQIYDTVDIEDMKNTVSKLQY